MLISRRVSTCTLALIHELREQLTGIRTLSLQRARALRLHLARRRGSPTSEPTTFLAPYSGQFSLSHPGLCASRFQQLCACGFSCSELNLNFAQFFSRGLKKLSAGTLRHFQLSGRCRSESQVQVLLLSRSLLQPLPEFSQLLGTRFSLVTKRPLHFYRGSCLGFSFSLASEGQGGRCLRLIERAPQLLHLILKSLSAGLRLGSSRGLGARRLQRALGRKALQLRLLSSFVCPGELSTPLCLPLGLGPHLRMGKVPSLYSGRLELRER
mmetsp:Transcript_6001/g.17397  ORF Transcript_6001/g.17397 Transcript_6001/m.17397 type:complete len:268 (+) Transcript_6001:45-848(+)